MAKPLKNAPLLTPDELTARLDELWAAIEQFNDGYWFESHETLEDLWQVTPLPGARPVPGHHPGGGGARAFRAR